MRIFPIPIYIPYIYIPYIYIPYIFIPYIFITYIYKYQPSPSPSPLPLPTPSSAVNEIITKANSIADAYSTNYTYKLGNLTNEIDALQLSYDKPTYTKLSSGVLYAASESYNHMDITYEIETERNLISILIFVAYLIMIGLAFLGFIKRWPKFLLGLSISLMLSIPLLLLFEGMTATYYFVYSDMCESVHSAMYENQFPVYNKGMGYFASCFNATTQSSVYAFNYQLEEINQIATNKKEESSENYQKYLQLHKDIKETRETVLTPLMECRNVYEIIEKTEEALCKDGMGWANYLLSSYSWLTLIVLLSAIAVNRMKPLVEKKNVEMESMLINEDAIY